MRSRLLITDCVTCRRQINALKFANSAYELYFTYLFVCESDHREGDTRSAECGKQFCEIVNCCHSFCHVMQSIKIQVRFPGGKPPETTTRTTIAIFLYLNLTRASALRVAFVCTRYEFIDAMPVCGCAGVLCICMCMRIDGISKFVYVTPDPPNLRTHTTHTHYGSGEWAAVFGIAG